MMAFVCARACACAFACACACARACARARARARVRMCVSTMHHTTPIVHMITISLFMAQQGLQKISSVSLRIST